MLTKIVVQSLNPYGELKLLNHSIFEHFQLKSSLEKNVILVHSGWHIVLVFFLLIQLHSIGRGLNISLSLNFYLILREYFVI